MATLITEYKHQEWQIIPVPGYSDCFVLEETKTGNVLGRFMLAEGGDPTFLNLIAFAPELQIIAERCREAMRNSRDKNAILFSMATKILRCVAQPRAVEVALWI